MSSEVQVTVPGRSYANSSGATGSVLNLRCCFLERSNTDWIKSPVAHPVQGIEGPAFVAGASVADR